MDSILAHLTAAKQMVIKGMQIAGSGSTGQSSDSEIIINPDVLEYDPRPNPDIIINPDVLDFNPTTQPVPAPTSPHPMPPDLANVPYDQLQQVSSHNSYQTEVHGDRTLTEQFEEDGIHSFELDIHIGDASPEIPFLQDDTTLPDDYYVYHDSSDAIPFADGILEDQLHWGSGTNYESLTDGLQEIYTLDNEMPVTLFVDVKDTLNGDHGPDVLNNLLQGELKEKIFTPQDLMDWAGTDNLQDAVANGWPTAEDLNGKVMVVLTGDLSGYIDGSDNPAAFIAPSPQTDAHAEGFEHVPDSDAIFYNTNDPSIAADVRDGGYPVRVYGFDTPNLDAQESDANHLGTNAINPDTNGYPDSPDDTDPFNVLEP